MASNKNTNDSMTTTTESKTLAERIAELDASIAAMENAKASRAALVLAAKQQAEHEAQGVISDCVSLAKSVDSTIDDKVKLGAKLCSLGIETPVSILTLATSIIGRVSKANKEVNSVSLALSYLRNADGTLASPAPVVVPIVNRRGAMTNEASNSLDSYLVQNPNSGLSDEAIGKQFGGGCSGQTVANHKAKLILAGRITVAAKA